MVGLISFLITGKKIDSEGEVFWVRLGLEFNLLYFCDREWGILIGG